MLVFPMRRAYTKHMTRKRLAKTVLSAGAVLALVVGAGMVLASLDAYETLYHFTRTHEAFDLDEYILMVPGALLALAWLVWRQGGWLRREMARRIQAERAARDALAEAVREQQLRKEFIVNVSHELTTPLNGILGMLQLLAVEEDPDQTRSEIALAMAATRSLQDIVSSVGVFVELDEHSVAEGHETFSLRDLLANCLDRFRPLAVEKGIGLDGGVDESVPERCRTHRVLLQLVLNNMVSNAVKFTEHGRVDVRVSYGAGGGEAVLEVSDTGPGIAAEEQERIFGRRYRVGDGSVPGLGLGLSLLYHALELLGGSVRVDSEPGRGARFTVTVPVED